MSVGPLVNLRTLLPLVAASLLLIAVACGGTAATPVIIEKEVIKEVIKEVPVEVIKEVPVTVISRPTNTPLPVNQALAGISPATPSPSQQPQYGAHINMRAYADTKDWDPLGSSSLSSVISYSQLYNQIVQFDTIDTDKVVCDLCTSWDISNGGETFTFHLNENIKWHDGEDLTSEDVVFSLSRYYNPDVSPGRSGLTRNYVMPVAEGGLRAVDRNTVEFNLQFASSAFLKFLAVDYVKVLPKHLLEQDIDLNQAENVIKHKSGSGPFMLDEYKRGNTYKVTKNPNYFKEGRPFFGSIDHFIIVEAARFISAFKAGQIEMGNSGTAQLTPEQNAEIVKDTNGEVVPHVMSPGFNVGLMINVKKEPFTDPRIRKALYLAIDRQQINDIVLDGTGGVTSIFMPGMAYSEEEALTWPGVRPKTTAGGKEDLAEAKKLMAEAGFPDGFKTTFDSRKVSFYSPVCQIVKEQLKKTLGIEGDLQIWESAAGYKHYGTARGVDAEGDWGLACQGEGMLILDADAVYGGVYRAGGTRNYTNWTHPVIEALYEKQKVEFDVDKRAEINREAADFLRSFDDNHWVTLVWGRWFWQVNRDIKGFHPPKTVQYGFKHEDLWLDR